MDSLTARPNILKQANLSLIRRAIKAKGTSTRAEIAIETRISSTTIRSLLSEMLENGEIESIGLDESSGGRKAQRYRLNPEFCYGAAFCLFEDHVVFLLVNIYGEIAEKEELKIQDGNVRQTLLSFLDDLIGKKEIKSIGLGVPGIVENGCYWKKSKEDGNMYKSDIGIFLSERYQLPVIMENDINATAIGFGRCYAKEFPEENPEDTNMAFLHFEEHCVSAGFISAGRIIRGCGNFAGELGLLPVDADRLLDECMMDPMDDVQYVNLMIKILSWVCGILNPAYIALGGPALRPDCIGAVSDGLSALLSGHMAAEILYSPDVRHDYYDGLASLTAGRIFEEIQFIRE